MVDCFEFVWVMGIMRYLPLNYRIFIHSKCVCVMRLHYDNIILIHPFQILALIVKTYDYMIIIYLILPHIGIQNIYCAHGDDNAYFLLFTFDALFLANLFREPTIAMTKHVDSYFVHERALKYTYAEFAPVAHNPCNGFLKKS